MKLNKKYLLGLFAIIFIPCVCIGTDISLNQGRLSWHFVKILPIEYYAQYQLTKDIPEYLDENCEALKKIDIKLYSAILRQRIIYRFVNPDMTDEYSNIEQSVYTASALKELEKSAAKNNICGAMAAGRLLDLYLMSHNRQNLEHADINLDKNDPKMRHLTRVTDPKLIEQLNEALLKDDIPAYATLIKYSQLGNPQATLELCTHSYLFSYSSYLPIQHHIQYCEYSLHNKIFSLEKKNYILYQLHDLYGKSHDLEKLSSLCNSIQDDKNSIPVIFDKSSCMDTLYRSSNEAYENDPKKAENHYMELIPFFSSELAKLKEKDINSTSTATKEIFEKIDRLQSKIIELLAKTGNVSDFINLCLNPETTPQESNFWTTRECRKGLSNIADRYYEENKIDYAFNLYKQYCTYDIFQSHCTYELLKKGELLTDRKQAIKHYELALSISKDNYPAQIFLGSAYLDENTPESLNKAIYQLEKAKKNLSNYNNVEDTDFKENINGKLANLSHNIAVAYNKLGNKVKSFEFFLDAAKYNSPQDQLIVADCYVRGYGVPIDYVTAYAWISIALLQGLDKNYEHDAEILKKHLLDSLSASQFAKAKSLEEKYYETYVTDRKT